ncbi:hypothetical protein F5B17DRAFT_404316 [Nemania serpens]|nr:hypothetical protein F5B17DRAFT_404316 [Nemania serpens]
MEADVLQPSHPVQTFSTTQAQQGFRLLLSGNPTGKILRPANTNDTVPIREGDDLEYRF